MAYKLIITERAEKLLDYIIVFRVNGENVYIMGIYHQLENYRKKIKDM